MPVWIMKNPLLAVIGLMALALAVYKGQAWYYKNQATGAKEIVRQQSEALKSVEKANETKRGIDRIAGDAVRQRLQQDWCRDCQGMPDL